MATTKKEREKQKIQRIGEVNYNTYGSKMTIIDYIDTNNVLIEFEDGYIVNNKYINFQTGSIKSPYDKSVCNIGYIGEGDYKTRVNGIKINQYEIWHDMMKRCYSEKLHNKRPTYIGCSVCEEWYNFQMFCDWYQENFYQIEDETMCLDKDILHKGNKIYSPENCVFVPNNINCLFTKTNSKRGNYPIGVSFKKKDNKYASRSCDGSKNRIYLGEYDTPEQAFYLGYKPFKEKIIKQNADKYKNKIPQHLYDAMYKYEVEITD